ncbi:type I glyceraldehyde-3-phosphate dehydrogenase [Rickettsiales endosymbiont of Stachyamoeba lipophora]|nr:type I glyceraldehyde-3-phosphate dehydrogenase [Rickettsiales endosymbiont of Stachyamoeba lipophora]AZL16444.1 type I glyceraldehyde-3-phosphate dehydrogenase [Rickettsiales endosymbiont of Stachyamoeba lipophora]
MNIGINGLGRVGRGILRALLEYDEKYNNINLVAINSPARLEEQLHLIKYDSVFGRLTHQIHVADDTLVIGRHTIKITHEKEINKLHWQQKHADIVLECSGKFNSKNLAKDHLKQGAKKIIISAPCEGADKTIILGVNENDLTPIDQIISIGSCTTNCVAPVVNIIQQKIGILSGFMTTVHSYTNDQNIIDASHKDLRRARAAGLSIIPTTTGATKIIGQVIPALNGKLKGAAIRIPTPNVSLIDLTLQVAEETSVEEINQTLKNASLSNPEILGITEEPLVSIDFIKDPRSAIIDLQETQVVGNNLVRIVAWYDNEWGFSCRMLDMVHLMRNFS